MKLLTKRVQFSKGELDDFGMPSDYQAYLIRARKASSGEAATISAGIAKVYTLSNQAIPLNPEYIIGDHGLEDALRGAIERLKEEHKGYSFREFEELN